MLDKGKERSTCRTRLKGVSGEASSVQAIHGDSVSKELSSEKDWWR